MGLSRSKIIRNAQGKNIEYRMMPPRTECDSTFPRSLKEISGINYCPLLRTDQKHARTKTMLGGADQSSMFATKNNPKNKNVPFDRISPTLLGGAGPVEYAESANDSVITVQLIFVNSEYMESANDCVSIA